MMNANTWYPVSGRLPIARPYTRPTGPRFRNQVGRFSAQPRPPSISISIAARPNAQANRRSVLPTSSSFTSAAAPP